MIVWIFMVFELFNSIRTASKWRNWIQTRKQLSHLLLFSFNNQTVIAKGIFFLINILFGDLHYKQLSEPYRKDTLITVIHKQGHLYTL